MRKPTGRPRDPNKLRLDPALAKGRTRYSRGRHIYFIQGGPEGLIKIGSANNPWKRFEVIQTCCPIRLQLLGVMWEHSFIWERSLHYQFKHLRQHGEWFRPAPELLAYIAEHASDPYDPPQPSEVAS